MKRLAIIINIVLSAFIASGCSTSMKKVDDFGQQMKQVKKVGVIASEFDLVCKSDGVSMRLVYPDIMREVGVNVEEALAEKISGLPFQAKMISVDPQMKNSLDGDIRRAIGRKRYVGSARRAVGEKGLIEGIDKYFKKNDIDLLFIFSGFFSLDAGAESSLLPAAAVLGVGSVTNAVAGGAAGTVVKVLTGTSPIHAATMLFFGVNKEGEIICLVSPFEAGKNGDMLLKKDINFMLDRIIKEFNQMYAESTSVAQM